MQFVFGRFKDRTQGDSPLPKTLEDARKLVSSPHLGDDEDSFDHSGRSSPALDDPLNSNPKATDAKLLELLGGRKPLRDRSVDSSRSGGSNKRVGFAAAPGQMERAKDEPATPSAANLFTTINNINPLNRFNVPSFAPSFARFGRAGSMAATGSAQPSPSLEKVEKLAHIVESPVGTPGPEASVLEKQRVRNGDTDEDDLNAREVLAGLRRLKPPPKRFLSLESAGDLKISEVEELLQEYKRLAKAIGDAIAM